MIRIEMTPYEQKDILDVLDYALGQVNQPSLERR